MPYQCPDGNLFGRNHELGLRFIYSRTLEQARTLTLDAEPDMTDVFSVALTGKEGPLGVISFHDGEDVPLLMMGDLISLV